MEQPHIRNFVIISHVDHGKSTLADRFLELTGTVEKQKMREQFLDMNPLERERGITIKMQPVRMLWHPDRRVTQKETQNNAENEFLYGDLTYKIRGALFAVRKTIGLGHKEQVYHNALTVELSKVGLTFESKKNLSISYNGKIVGTYQPDFVVEDKILVELKALPEIGRSQIEQLWSYLKGCSYKVALLANFGSTDFDIKRVVYDTARSVSAQSASSLRVSAGVSDQVESREYILNLIDTPGHVDFSYEVSRALAAVEGAILLVDGTQGVQAQTLAHLELAKKEGLTILGAINKIDLLVPSLSQLKDELAGLIGCTPPEIFAISGKTGTGVADLLEAVVARVPPPSGDPAALLRALIFDSIYDTFQGAVAYVRVVDGSLGRNEMVRMVAAARNAKSSEIGFFKPQRVSTERLSAGEIGYVATSIKEVGAVRVGDTLTTFVSRVDPLPGYAEPKPMVFAGFYPKDAKELTALKDALAKLKLNDAALMFEPCRQEALGQGFRVGFLGALHLEIVKERVAREYALEPFITLPSVWYKVKSIKGEEVDVFTPGDMPPEGLVQEIREPWVALEIIAREEDMQSVMKLVREKRGVAASFETMGSGRITIKGEMPLAELIVDFHDRLKSVSRGFASMSYTLVDWRPGDLVKLDILIAGELHDAFSRIVPRLEAERAGRRIVEKLKEILPREVFSVPLQAAVGSRILARSTMPALKKDVTGHLYGGDRTRKMKLWKKQQEGKKRLREIGRVEVPSSAFFEILKLG